VQISIFQNFSPSRLLRIFSTAFFLSFIVTNQAISASVNLDENIEFKHLTTADGLSQSYVFDIVQDHEGYIWIATQDGLNKFDGKNFTYYRSNTLDPNSIADNYIRNLFIDENKQLWIGTDNGLSKYNNKLDNFENFLHNDSDSSTLLDNVIWSIYQDEKSVIWVTTKKGLHKYDALSSGFSRIKVYGLNDELQEVKTVFQDEKNNFWLGTFENGVYIANKDFSFATNIQETIKAEQKLSINALYDIKEIDSNYWLATDNGVFIIDKQYNLIKHYHLQNKSSEQVKALSLNQTTNSRVWIGTDTGLKVINILDGTQKSIGLSNNNLTESNAIYNLYMDKTNKLWVGTLNGAFIYDPLVTTISKSQSINRELNSYVNAITSLDNELWLSHDESLIHIKTNGDLDNVSPELNGEVFDLLSNHDSLFIQTNANDLFQLNRTNQQLTKHENWGESTAFNEPERIYLQEKTIWFISTDGTLTSYNIETEKNKKYPSQYEGKLTSLTINDSGNFWMTNEKGNVLSFDPQEFKFTNFIIEKKANYAISKSTSIAVSQNKILLGSDNQGVLLIDKLTGKTRVFNEESLLANNFIADLLVDKNNNFWVSTNKGISTISAKSDKVRSFYKDFSLSNIEFISNSSTISNDGIMYFGGSSGFISFSPSSLLTVSQEINEPILTDLLIANKKISIVDLDNKKSNELKLPAHINILEQLNLQYIHSQFSFEFVSPNAKLPNQLGYKYRLKGFDQNWIETDVNNRHATYTNLNAGDYTFEIQAYDLFNPETLQYKKLKIHIMPPWWLSNSAILIYTLIGLLVLAYFLQQLRHKRLYHLQIKLSEERLKLSLWGSGDEMWDWNIEKSKIYRSNIWGILEFPQDGKRNLGNANNNETNIHKQDISRIRVALDEHFAEKTEHFEATYRVKNKDNKWIWVLDRGKVVERDENNEPSRMTGTLKDISQIKKADERLKLFAKCIENISDAVVIYDRQFNIVDVNKSYQRITGRKKSDKLGTSLRFSRYPESFTQDVKKHLMQKGSWHGEIESKRNNGELYLTDLNIDIIRDESKNISHFVGVFSDITKRKETEAELRRLANSDTLTGLPNRSYFQANQARLVKNRVPHALLVFDLDNFKKVNDSMGHEVGDILLCKVAQRIRAIGRKKDTVYRLGGDEFSIIVEDTNDIHTITTIAKDILKVIAEPFKLKNQELVLFSSIGIVLYPEDGISPQELLKNADTAMYHAKHNGGNKYQFFNDSMNKKAVKRLQIESLIRHGLKEDFFSVFYQPKIEIATGKVAGMEALVRFETPSKGIISPVVFIPVSEETGQIIDIGEIVLRKACHATKSWIDAGLFDGRIAVNLSAVQFTQSNLVGMIADILKESRLPAKYLELEITEGTVMDSPQKAIDTMLQIRAMGIHLSLDDFGTGYSSLAYLKKFPLNTLKIDKAFVDDIEESEQGRNMVATIVTIAHNLGLQVVAEGVETNQQLSFLSGLRCEQLQGYLYSKPLPERDFRSYLLSHQITDKSTSFNKS